MTLSLRSKECNLHSTIHADDKKGHSNNTFHFFGNFQTPLPLQPHLTFYFYYGNVLLFYKT